MITSKSGLAIALSSLKTFESPKTSSEQYSTDSEIAAAILWNAAMLGDIEDKTIADLGCGTGILGIGALLLGAAHVTFIDNDNNSLFILKTNLKQAGIAENFKIVNKDVTKINLTTDITIQNPPFGTKQKHADKKFLEKAFLTSKIIYSVHKEESTSFLQSIARDYSFTISHHWKLKLPLKQTMHFHKSKIKYIDVGCWRFVAKDLTKFI